MVSASNSVYEAGELACVAGEYTDLAEVACVGDDLVGAACVEATEVGDEAGHLGCCAGYAVLTMLC